jgi:transposase
VLTGGCYRGEYKCKYPDGFGYSQFCYYYRCWQSQQSFSGHFEHIAGEKAYMDFTGKRLHIVDRESGHYFGGVPKALVPDNRGKGRL